MHWDGIVLSLVPSPNAPQGGNNELYAVDALAGNDVWAVGTGFYRPLALHWDGQSWNIQAFPTQPLGDYVLNDVVALAPNNIWAVGKNTAQAITFHWDGSSWHDASPASGNLASESFYGVTAVNASDIWAVGHVNIAYNDGPMLARRFAPSVAFDGPSFRRSTSPSVTVPITLTSTAPYTVSVHYATSNGSALAGTDYVDTSGTLQIPPCAHTASFPVTLLDSPTWKPAAYANIALDNPSGASPSCSPPTSLKRQQDWQCFCQ
jgi:hypothetical protein